MTNPTVCVDDGGILQSGWTRNTESLCSIFTVKEIDRLESARRGIDPESATIVYCVYENPFGKSGGIFAVADNYANELQRQGRSVVVFSPLHGNLETAPAKHVVEHVGTCRVPFGCETVELQLFEHRRNGVRWILLRADGFFEAEGGDEKNDPYVHSRPSNLLIDSLFASIAIPHALAALNHTQNLIVHVQDWELASAALTIKLAILKNLVTNAAVVLTSHNPYDRPLSPEFVRLLTGRAFHGSRVPETVYQWMIPLTDGPLTTVSRSFARELTSDAIQTTHFAIHLQDVFHRQGLCGIDNGLFGRPEPTYTADAIQEARDLKPVRILNEKRAKRELMLRTLEQYQDHRRVGHLDAGDGRPLTQLAEDIPVFLMFGRLDPGQKGFDVFAQAIRGLPRGRARFVFTPNPAGAPAAFRDDLFRLAESRPGEVVVYPFWMDRGYRETMAGATYAVMPSIYEPFGAATEPYLLGTPVVARGTGGLMQQVIDVDLDCEHGTGLLYCEPAATNDADWVALQQAENPDSRMSVPVYGTMVAALAAALTRAGDIYRAEPATYGRMLANLFDQCQQFSWTRAASEYQRVYELATQ